QKSISPASLAVLDDGCIGEGAGKACGRGVGSRVLHLPRRVLPTSDGGSPARHRHSSLTATPVACEFTLPFVPTISGISVSAHSTGSACVYVSLLLFMPLYTSSSNQACAHARDNSG
uniref:Uncharacterized protein n=1 Tax=Aegilops tauschii subsp. strangulata TaxID=200361 RepID=A0A453EPE7_AEGTS